MMNKKIMDKLKQINVDNILQMSHEDFVKFLIEQGLFKEEKDIKLFILEHIGYDVMDDSIDFPITYYNEDEEIKEDELFIDLRELGLDSLTDKFIEEIKKTE